MCGSWSTLVALKRLLGLTGLNTPQGQALAVMAPMDVGPNGGIAGAVQKVIKAYHGSPHDFERFSMDKIGTGEGAQAYGHGLYFADQPAVAQSYRDALSAAGFSDVEVFENAAKGWICAKGRR